MTENDQFMAHTWVVGSSTAKGYGGKPGFDQLLMGAYEGPNSYNWRDNKVEQCRYVLIHREGEPGVHLPLMARQFRRRAELGLELSDYDPLPRRLLGIFVVSNVLSPRTVESMGGPCELWASWEKALETITHDCQDLNIDPVVLTTPAPAPEVVYRDGFEPDLEIYEGLARVTTQAAAAMNARLVTFERIVGEAKPDCVAPDGVHPNTLGHTLIAEHLSGLINEHFGVPSDQVWFPA